jgi:hypothetical protein
MVAFQNDRQALLTMQNPLGKYGNLVAAILAVMVVAVWLASTAGIIHAGDTSLADVAKLTIGIVFGTQVVQNGTQSKALAALAQADAAQRRMDAAGLAPTPHDPVDRRT